MTVPSDKQLLRLVTTGSVDDGKSTLIGRLLYETRNVFEDQLAAIERTSRRKGLARADLSLLLDGLAAEREQSITIDVAWRYFETTSRKFIIADSPGHEQYTRNMITAASNADVAMILIDARNGILTQSRRHGFLISLLGIPHLIVAINKMDLVDYSQDTFNSLVTAYNLFSEKLGIPDISYIPVSALNGDNVVSHSAAMPWYHGRTILEQLENIHVTAGHNLVDFRFPVQYVLRPHQDFRGYAGRIESGTISVGEEVAVLPSGARSKVTQILAGTQNVSQSFSPQSVTITLADQIDVSRGDMIVRTNNLPTVGANLDTTLCWMDTTPLSPARSYLIRHTTRTAKAFINRLHYAIDVNTLHRQTVNTLNINEIGRCDLTLSQPVFFDSYVRNRTCGSFILIDPLSNATVAAGIIRGSVQNLDILKERVGHTGIVARQSSNVSFESQSVSRADREARQGHRAAVLWLTGLSAAGKSTIARSLEKQLFSANCQVMVLDGDNVRHGLCGDLGFTFHDRSENIRRVSEVAKLFFDKGFIVICTFISPFRADRQFARNLIDAGRFFEIYVSCDIEVCKRRDPKHLYARALAGEIPDFTGISSPYEEPLTPELTVATELQTVEEITGRLVHMLQSSDIIPSCR